MSKYTRWVIKKGGKKGNKNSLGSWRWRVRKQKKNKRPQLERWKSYIFHMKYLKTHSERFWVLLPSFSCYFFWKRMHFKMSWWIEKPNPDKNMNMDAMGWCDSRKKGQKYLAFLTALHFMKTMIRIKMRLVGERTHSTTENWTTSSFGVHHYKEMQPGKLLYA